MPKTKKPEKTGKKNKKIEELQCWQTMAPGPDRDAAKAQAEAIHEALKGDEALEDLIREVNPEFFKAA